MEQQSTPFQWRERFGLFLALLAGIALLIVAAGIHEVSNQAGGDLDSLNRGRVAVAFATELHEANFAFEDYRYRAILGAPTGGTAGALAQARKSFGAVAAFSAGPGAGFGVGPQTKELLAAWARYQTQPQVVSSSQAVAVRLIALFDAVEESSRLIYDPNVRGANFADIVFANNPRVARSIGYSTILAGTFMQAARPTMQQRIDLAIAVHGLPAVFKVASEDFAATIQQDGAGNTGDLIASPAYRDLQSAAPVYKGFAAFLSRVAMAEKPSAFSMRNLAQHRNAALAALQTFNAAAGAGLAQNLENRMAFERQRRRLYQLATILGALFFIGLMLEVVRFVARHDREELRRAQEESARLSAELAREHAEKALALTEAQFRAVFDGAAIGIAILDRDASVVDANSVFRDHFGRDSSAFLDGRSADLEGLWNGRRELFEFERHYAPEGREELWVDATVSVVNDGSGKPQFAMCMFRDITDLRRSERRMVHDMTHDGLTGLPNRALFETQLRDRFAESSTLLDSFFAVLFVDLDNFKDINESLGHSAGDSVLQQVAARLRGLLDPSDLVSRLGSDEFAVLVRSLGDVLHVESVARRILNNVAKPIQVGERAVFAACSIGIAIGSATYEHAEDVIRDAHTAMSHAKSTGGTRYALFDSNMHARAERRLQLTTDLRFALQREEFRLLYQPIVRIADGRLVGCEALIRWDHPTEGLILPNDFISPAEQTGLVIPIGKFVFETACRQLAEWRSSWAGAPEPPFAMSVNVSASEIFDTEFEQFVVGTCQRYGVEPRELILEITESVVLDSNSRVNLLFERLQSHGFKICIDDFGTGYSSLRYLQQFRIDQLKIDRSFVAAPDGEIASEPIVRTLMTLAEAFDLKVVAEGVETQRQRDILRQAGCRFAQGHYYSRAVSAPELTAMYPEVLAQVAGEAATA